MNWLATVVPITASSAADDSREQAEKRALERHQRQDVPLRPAIGPEHAELDEPLGRAHQHRVDDAHDPHHEAPG